MLMERKIAVWHVNTKDNSSYTTSEIMHGLGGQFENKYFEKA